MITVTLGTHHSSQALLRELERRGIGLDPLTRALWSQVVPAQAARTISLLAMEPTNSSHTLSGNDQGMATDRVVEHCPAETAAALLLQHREWLTGRRALLDMQPLRLPEVLSDHYAYRFCLADGRISTVNISEAHALPPGTILIAAHGL